MKTLESISFRKEKSVSDFIKNFEKELSMRSDSKEIDSKSKMSF
jgi:hypothetical protein